MLTHTRTVTYATNAGAAANNAEANTGDGEISYDGTIPAATTDMEIDLALVRANVRAMLVVSSVDATVKTNSSSVPDDTISLHANVALTWTLNDPRAIPFTADVTKLFVTVPGAAASTFKVRALIDLTPAAADPA